MPKHSPAVFVLLCALLASSALAMIQEFTTSSKNNMLTPNKTEVMWTAMYSLADAPAGSQQPTVSINLHIQRASDLSATDSPHLHAAALIYELSYSSLVAVRDAADPKSTYYCCSSTLKAEKKCPDNVEVGQLIFTENPNVYVAPIKFGTGETSIVVQKTVNVSTTGYYFLQITNCGGEGLGTLTLSGEAVWLNPYGYLPGEVYALLPLYGALSLGYLAVALYYGFLMFRYRTILLKIQWGVFGVIIAGVIEVSAWYFYRVGINNNGHYSILGLVVVVFINAVKKMVSRVLVLLVSMGVGTVKWTIGQTTTKLSLLAMFYLFFAFLLQLVKEIEAVAKQDVVNNFVNMTIVVSAAILDALFYYWIILSLIRTMQQLTLRRQQLKLDMYKSFFVVIASAAALSVLMVLYEAYLNFTKETIAWQNQWVSDAFWELLFFGLMVAIAIIWRPRNNNTRYSYAEFFEGSEVESNKLDDDNTSVQLETLTVLGGGGDVSKKTRRRDEDDDGIPDSSSSSRPEPTPKPTPIDPAERVRQATAQMTNFEKDIMAFELPSDDEEEGGISVETQIKKMD